MDSAARRVSVGAVARVRAGLREARARIVGDAATARSQKDRRRDGSHGEQALQELPHAQRLPPRAERCNGRGPRRGAPHVAPSAPGSALPTRDGEQRDGRSTGGVLVTDAHVAAKKNKGRALVFAVIGPDPLTRRLREHSGRSGHPSSRASAHERRRLGSAIGAFAGDILYLSTSATTPAPRIRYGAAPDEVGCGAVPGSFSGGACSAVRSGYERALVRSGGGGNKRVAGVPGGPRT